jgi:hypothetical protein
MKANEIVKEYEELSDDELYELQAQEQKREEEEMKKLFEDGDLFQIKSVVLGLQKFSDDSDIKRWLIMNNFDPERLIGVWEGE